LKREVGINMIDLGIIGVRGFARTHHACIGECERRGLCRLKAAAVLPKEQNEPEAAELRARGVAIHDSAQALFDAEKGRLSLITIPCGIAQHAPLSIQAMKHGFHVLCEKPAAGTTAEALEMRETAGQTGRILAIGYQNMYSRAIQTIKSTVREGELGRLLSAKTMVLWPRGADYYARNEWAGRLATGGRTIYDSPVQNAVSHYLQNMLYIAGEDADSSAAPEIVYGENYRAQRIESADTQYLRIGIKTGATLRFMVSHATDVTRQPESEYRFEDGRITWTFEENGATRIYRGRGLSERLVDTLHNEDEDIRLLPFIETIRAVEEGTKPAATVDNCLQHTMCVEALFAPPNEIHDVSAKYTEVSHDPRPHNTTIRGIVELMARMYEQDQSYFEAGAPWGRRGVECTPQPV
jgi:predicted dehydrogenase